MWVAGLVFAGIGIHVRAVNRDFAVFIEWTDGEDIGVSDNTLGDNIDNHESGFDIRGFPNGLRVLHNAVCIEDVSIKALNIFSSALLKTPTPVR